MNQSKYIGLILLVGCKVIPASYQSNDEPFSDETKKEVFSPPEWVQKKPVKDGYYIGIGNASLSDQDYQQTAKLEALDDLSSEISISISSTSLLNQLENDSHIYETYQSSINSSSNNDLQAYELVDSWNDRDQYWTYYQLKKETFKEHRAKSKKKALVLAKDSYEMAESALLAGDYMTAISFFARCIDELDDYLNEPNEIIINDKSILLANEAFFKMRKIISGIQLSTNTSMQHDLKSINLKVKATYEGKPIKSLPLNINALNISKSTDFNGTISFNVYRRNYTTPIKVEADFDFSSSPSLISHLLKNQVYPDLYIDISFPALSFSVTANEINLGKKLSNSFLSPVFTQIIREKKAIIGDKGKTEYHLEIFGETHKGSETSGLYCTYLDIHFQIKNQKGEVICKDVIYDIRGLHTSYEKAGLKAYRKTENEASEQIKESLNIHFFNKN